MSHLMNLTIKISFLGLLKPKSKKELKNIEKKIEKDVANVNLEMTNKMIEIENKEAKEKER